jgi:hypothetical protein
MAALPTLDEIDAYLLRQLQQLPTVGATNNRFPQATRRYWINQFQRDIPFRNPPVTLRKLEARTADSDGIITPPADFLTDAYFWYTGGLLSEQTGTQQYRMRPMSRQGVDEKFTLINEVAGSNQNALYVSPTKASDGSLRFQVFPKFANMDTANAFYMNYCSAPPDLTSGTDTMTWLKPFESLALELPAMYAAMKLYFVDPDGQMFAKYAGYYDALLKDFQLQNQAITSWEDSMWGKGSN